MHTPLSLAEISRLQALGRAVIRTEATAVLALEARINVNFAKACAYLLACEGRVVISGMGKSGHIGSKIAATLASTGTPAFFVHPGEASHGDLGMITSKDVVIALSNSGETAEILTILPRIRRLGIPLIALVGHVDSTIAAEADVTLDVSVAQEACPLGLAPTASTTAALAMGDALAIALLESRGFTAEDFACSHPAGSLGRRLLLRVSDLMHTGQAIPQVQLGTPLAMALVEMSRKTLGMTAIVDSTNQVVGVYTDGDLRRTLDRGLDIRDLLVDAVMTHNCHTVPPHILAAQALQLMESRKINGLLVVDAKQHLVGALNMHDLLRAKVL